MLYVLVKGDNEPHPLTELARGVAFSSNTYIFPFHSQDLHNSAHGAHNSGSI